jgi:hypothetical protein
MEFENEKLAACCRGEKYWQKLYSTFDWVSTIPTL